MRLMLLPHAHARAHKHKHNIAIRAISPLTRAKLSLVALAPSVPLSRQMASASDSGARSAATTPRQTRPIPHVRRAVCIGRMPESCAHDTPPMRPSLSLHLATTTLLPHCHPPLLKPSWLRVSLCPLEHWGSRLSMSFVLASCPTHRCLVRLSGGTALVSHGSREGGRGNVDGGR